MPIAQTLLPSGPETLHVVGFTAKEPARVVPMHSPLDEADSFTALYARYSPLVRKYIDIVGGPGAYYPEDLEQDIFLRLWQNRRTLHEIKSLESYLFITVRNMLINQWQKTAFRRNVLKRINTDTADKVAFAEEDINCRRIIRTWKDGIRTLPPQSRKVYEMKEQTGMRTEDIAKEMGICNSMAKQHLQNAVKKLKAYLVAQGCY